MAIDGVSNTVAVYSLLPSGTSGPDGPAAQILDEGPLLLGPPDDEEAETGVIEAEDEEVSEDGQAAGVLRLLQEGHFKGVADVRLRINFHEQIAAADAEATRLAATEVVGGLSGMINAQLDELASSGEFSEQQLTNLAELQTTLNESLEATVATVPGANGAADESVTRDIRQAFDSLTTLLESLLAPNPDPQAEQPPVEETTDYQVWLRAFREAFEGAMLNLGRTLVDTSSLPPLTQPTGRGVAYEKFLAIYRELQASPQSQESAPESPVDVDA